MFNDARDAAVLYYYGGWLSDGGLKKSRYRNEGIAIGQVSTKVLELSGVRPALASHRTLPNSPDVPQTRHHRIRRGVLYEFQCRHACNAGVGKRKIVTGIGRDVCHVL